jgi:hypothetical protein
MAAVRIIWLRRTIGATLALSRPVDTGLQACEKLGAPKTRHEESKHE